MNHNIAIKYLVNPDFPLTRPVSFLLHAVYLREQTLYNHLLGISQPSRTIRGGCCAHRCISSDLNTGYFNWFVNV